MADETPENDLKFEPDDAGVAFRAEMALTDFLMGNWMFIAGGIVLFLASVAVYGFMDSNHTASQRRTTAAIADLKTELLIDDLGLTENSSLLSLSQIKAGMTRPGETAELDAAALTEAAAGLVSLGDKGSYTAAVEAYLKAAELYRLADDDAGRRTALEKASAGAEGVLKYAAEAGLANLEIATDQVDQGLGRLRSFKDDGDSYIAQQATLDLASALEAVGGRDAEALQAYDHFLATWPDASNTADVQSRREALSGAAPAPE